MRNLAWLLCSLAALALGAGCASSPDKRPQVYRGGQYYGDALHAQDLDKPQPKLSSTQ